MTIDHEKPGDNKIFVTCDASDWRTGATLSWGKTWETARPVAFELTQLKPAEKNYPVHEKELLAIVQALKKWRSDLLGGPIFVYTDHRTLENFNTQCDLSRQQLRWQEYLSQYDISMVYIRGEDNTVADTLSRLPPDSFDDEKTASRTVSAVLKIHSDDVVLAEIKKGYGEDAFCRKIMEGKSTIPGVTEANGLWYVGDRLLIPHSGNLRETLFRLAHDASGHFGADKCYATLRSDYYWPNMQRDLESAYIPSCVDCQQNKSATMKPTGPLHPLPVPERKGDSVAIDFVGPLPVDEGFDGIATMTDRLGSDVRIVPIHINMTTEDFAVIFFTNWYCKNGLPLEIISDRDKLFTLRFWRVLHALTSVKLRMSSSFHPETDGASERSNKTLNQALRYHVQRNQKGWVRALPKIRFDVMNSVNASTGFSGFELRLGRAARVLPPIVPDRIPEEWSSTVEAAKATGLLEKMEEDMEEARDNLLAAKVTQAHHANARRGAEDVFKVGEKVMLSTLHRRKQYTRKGEKRSAKFFPRFDGPYTITGTHPETSNYTLRLPPSSTMFPTFHASELKRFEANDRDLFPSWELSRPGPIVTEEGMEEYLVEEIIDVRKRGQGWQFLVRWSGYGPEHDDWLPAKDLEECEALDRWYAEGGDGPAKVAFSPHVVGFFDAPCGRVR
jgi:hypothetical protein